MKMPHATAEGWRFCARDAGPGVYNITNGLFGAASFVLAVQLVPSSADEELLTVGGCSDPTRC